MKSIKLIERIIKKNMKRIRESASAESVSQQDIESAFQTLVKDGFRVIDEPWNGRNYMIFSEFVEENEQLFPGFDLSDEDDLDTACRLAAEVYDANETELETMWNEYN